MINSIFYVMASDGLYSIIHNTFQSLLIIQHMFVTHNLISNEHFPLTIVKALLKVMMMNKLLTYLLTLSLLIALTRFIIVSGQKPPSALYLNRVKLFLISCD